MEVLYVAFADASLKGVYLKVTSTIDAMNRVGLSTKGLIISQKKDQILTQSKFDLLNGIVSKREAYRKIGEYIKSNYEKCPLILFRYPLSDKYLQRFMNEFRDMVVFEHNTIEEQELALYFKYYSFRDFLYNLRHLNFNDLYQNYKILKNESKYSRNVLGYAKAGISVTSEIANYEDKRAERQYNQAVIGNAIFANDIFRVKTHFKKIDSNLQCVFVAGHANNWHGFDRIISGIKGYRGNIKVTITVIGNVLDSVKRSVCDLGLTNCIKFVGPCDRNQMEEFLLNADIGISTLALHRIPLKQGSVLKSREYLLYGLPILIGYQDEEIECEKDLQKVVIQVTANDTPIDFNSIISQLNSLSEKNIDPNFISKTALDLFSIDNKARQIKKVLELLQMKN